MRITLKHFMLSSFAALMFVQAAHAANGVQAVQLDYVPLDSSIQCNRIIFTSSHRYRSTLFYMSRIVPGTGIDREHPYAITHGKVKGTYNLDINFYFPSDEEKLKKAKASSFKIDENACNWTQVKASVNEGVTDPLQKKIYTSPIPLSCVEVRLPGIAATASKGQCASNDGEVDILTYLGQSLRFTFVITEEERRAFESNIVTQQGVAAAVKLKFVATKRNGALTARVNFGTLVQDFQANAAVKGLQFVEVDQLSLVLRNSISSKSISIVREGGSSAATNQELQQVGQTILDAIMKEISMLPPVVQETEKIQKAGQGGGVAIKPKVSIAAALQLLQSKSSSEFTQEIIAAPETATAMSEIKLQVDRINDPDISEVVIRAGDHDPAWENVSAGESFTINPAYWAVDRIKYIRYRNFLTRSDIVKLNLATDFPRLLNPSLQVKDVTINGTYLAQGQWSPFAIPYLTSPRIYHWIREQVNAIRTQMQSGRIDATREAFEKLNVFVSFSRIGGGKMFSLNELIQDNPFWVGFYDSITNRLVITAKKDLGVVFFREKMNSKEEHQLGKPIVLDRIFEQRTPVWGPTEQLAEKILVDDDSPLIVQKKVVFFVTKPKVMDMREFDYIRKAAPAVDPQAPGMVTNPAAGLATP